MLGIILKKYKKCLAVQNLIETGKSSGAGKLGKLDELVKELLIWIDGLGETSFRML